MALCEIAEESISHISQFTQIGFTKEFADQKVNGFNYGMKARLYFYLLERMPCFTLKTIKCNIFALLSENVLSDIWKNPAYIFMHNIDIQINTNIVRYTGDIGCHKSRDLPFSYRGT